jgi:hypothetical protein
MGLALSIAQNCTDIPHSLSLSTNAEPIAAKKSAPIQMAQAVSLRHLQQQHKYQTESNGRTTNVTS